MSMNDSSTSVPRRARTLASAPAPMLTIGRCVAALVFGLAIATAAQAKPADRALVLAVVGDVQVREANSAAKTDASRRIKANATIPVGSEIRTGKKSTITLQLSRTLVCRIGPDSVVKLDALMGEAGLTLRSGSVGAQVQPGTNTHMKVVTPTAIAGVRGTEFIVETDAAADGSSGSDTSVYVNEGTVAVQAVDSEGNAGGEGAEAEEVEAGNKIVSDGKALTESVMEQFEKQKFAIFEEFEKLKKQNYDAYLEQVRRNEELKEQMKRPLGQ